MNKYIRLNEMTNEKVKEVTDALTKIGVSFDVFNYSTEAFFEEEAEMRLEMWEERNTDVTEIFF